MALLDALLIAMPPSQACELSELCADIPELETYIQYCRTLKFADQPDYEYLQVKSARHETAP